MRSRAALATGVLATALAALIAVALASRGCAGAPPVDVTAPPPSKLVGHDEPARERRRAPATTLADAPAADAAAKAATDTDAAAAPPAKPARIAVTVKRADGSPAAGVRVAVALSDQIGGQWIAPWKRLPDTYTDTTDDDGRAVIEAEHLWMAWTTASDGDQAAFTRKHVALRAGEEASVTLTLEPSFRVRGEVTDRDGRRVRAARVRMLIPDIGSTWTSSVGPYAWAVDPVECTDGAFEFAGVLPRSPPGDENVVAPRHFTIEARADGFLGVRTRFSAEQAAHGAPLSVTLVRTGVLRGRCTHADGGPVPGVVVTRPPDWKETFEGREWRSTTDADGRFVFVDFPEVGGSLGFGGAGFASRSVHVPAFDPHSGHDLGDVLLDGGLTARGRVEAPDGTPVPGASVYFGGANGKTDDHGRFVVHHLGRGPWRVYVQDDIGMRRAKLHVSDVSEPLTIVATNDRHVRLTVLFEHGSEPSDDPPYLFVAWRRPDEDAPSSRNERWYRGRYEIWLQPEEAGRWVVRVTMAGWEPVETPIDVLDGRAVEAQVTLRR